MNGQPVFKKLANDAAKLSSQLYESWGYPVEYLAGSEADDLLGELAVLVQLAGASICTIREAQRKNRTQRRPLLNGVMEKEAANAAGGIT